MSLTDIGTYVIDEIFADFVREQLAGETIAEARAINTQCPVQCVRLTFTDGTSVDIESEYDEGFRIRPSAA